MIKRNRRIKMFPVDDVFFFWGLECRAIVYSRIRMVPSRLNHPFWTHVLNSLLMHSDGVRKCMIYVFL